MNRTLKVRVDKLGDHNLRLCYLRKEVYPEYWLAVPYSAIRKPELEIHRLWCLQHAAKTIKNKG